MSYLSDNLPERLRSVVSEHVYLRVSEIDLVERALKVVNDNIEQAENQLLQADEAASFAQNEAIAAQARVEQQESQAAAEKPVPTEPEQVTSLEADARRKLAEIFPQDDSPAQDDQTQYSEAA